MIFFVISILIAIFIAYFISFGIYHYFINKSQKSEIDWIYGIWISLIIVVIILHFSLKIETDDFSILNSIFIILTIVIWKLSLSQEKFVLAKIFIILNIIFFSTNIYFKLKSNIFYIVSLYFLLIWIITVAFLTFKMKI